MAIVVQKYGGTSLSSTKRIKEVTNRILEEKRKGSQVVVVVSAMGSSTDSLVEMSKEISSHPNPREMDMLLSTGEQVTSSLVALALQSQGAEALSLTGGQAGIHTGERFGDASISFIDTRKIKLHLDQGEIVVVAGFQGVSENGEICTLGRGGSDTTAAALAGELKAERCEIFTDVEGVFTADPRIVKEAKKIPSLTYKQMQDLAEMGAGVVHPRAIHHAHKHHIPLIIRSSFNQKKGTRIQDSNKPIDDLSVIGVSVKEDLTCLKVELEKATDIHRLEAALSEVLKREWIFTYESLSKNKLSCALIIQTEDLSKVHVLLNKIKRNGCISDLTCETNVAIVSMVYNDENVKSRLKAHLVDKLKKENYIADIIYPRPRVCSVIVSENKMQRTVRLVHDTFIIKSLVPT